MHVSHLIPFFLNIYIINAAVLLWSTKKVEISPLVPFDDEDLDALVRNLDIEKVYLFKVSLKDRNAVVPKNLQEVMNGFYSSYNPNGNVATANAVEILLADDCNGIDTNKIQKTTGKLNNSTNFLCVLDITYPRKKRAIEESNTGAVIYIGQNKKDNQYALLYSSKPLKLEINNTTMYLGNTDNSLITVDKRFNIPIPLEGKEKVTLRFGIAWLSGYWYLQTVKVEAIMNNNESDDANYDLITEENIMASARFSYHCNGFSVFSDEKSGTKLTIYDLQVQIDAKNVKFGDVNDCIPFITAPIWSGLFVTTILAVGFIVALAAIMDIKTMDKFDNHKTKNLAITVMD
ncbi:hypothetical protein GWI33_012682 [Rhynchophorus ferrugineus]|uniref:Vacuolar ATP synthase subunit S1 n=1 Tax=Rhynchophorus ferrugineus TaxID=354439 RepID=A0A834MC85_RHYFE|nr:hypothetical protein GWI33_012682 [Rhynchophorus ferrugineus]